MPDIPMCAGKKRCGNKKECYMCQAEVWEEYWCDFSETLKVVVPEIILARKNSKGWFARCDEAPRLFLAQFASTLIKGEAPNTWRRASNWGAVPLCKEELKEWALDGALNKVASIRTWESAEMQSCGMAFVEMGQTFYVQWFEDQQFSIDIDELSDTDVADLVEAALALHLMTEHGYDLSCMGDTSVFANWLVKNLLKQ